MKQSCIKFPLDENGLALFIANDSVDDGILKVSVSKSNVPSPVSISFERGTNKFSFAMSKSETRRLLTYLISEGV